MAEASRSRGLPWTALRKGNRAWGQWRGRMPMPGTPRLNVGSFTTGNTGSLTCQKHRAGKTQQDSRTHPGWDDIYSSKRDGCVSGHRAVTPGKTQASGVLAAWAAGESCLALYFIQLQVNYLLIYFHLFARLWLTPQMPATSRTVPGKPGAQNSIHFSHQEPQVLEMSVTSHSMHCQEAGIGSGMGTWIQLIEVAGILSSILVSELNTRTSLLPQMGTTWMP